MARLTFVSFAAQIAQLVEHSPEEGRVVSSSLTLSTNEKTPTGEFFHLCSESKVPARFTVRLERRSDIACNKQVGVEST